LDARLLMALSHQTLPHVDWRAGKEHLELTMFSGVSKSSPGSAPGEPFPMIDGWSLEGAPTSGEVLRWTATLPRWTMWPHWESSSPSFKMDERCGGIGLSAMVLAVGLRAAQDPLIPFQDREHIAGIRNGLGLPQPWAGEVPQAPVGPCLVQLSSAPDAPGPPERLSLITPCGEALRQSLQEISGAQETLQLRLSTQNPSGRQWTWPAPRPAWNLEFDHGSGIAALPWRIHASDDASLRTYGWRRAHTGEWDKRGRTPGVELRGWLEEEADLRGKMRKVLVLSTPGRNSPLTARLLQRRSQ